MLVLFQRRIIYLPSVPPGTRDESLRKGERTTERDSSFAGMRWTEVPLTSSEPSAWLRRPVKLRGIELSWRRAGAEADPAATVQPTPADVVILYLQGNAGTPLLRTPLFRALLREPPSPRSSSDSPPEPRVSLFAIAPRSFWLSTRATPTERGILADYRAALAHAYARHGPEARYVLYGHSLGGAAAVLLLEQLRHGPFAHSEEARAGKSASESRQATALSNSPTAPSGYDVRSPASAPSSLASPLSASSSADATPRLSGIIVENPLPSIPYMVRALYPQRWLPYHYLGPFAFDKWDAVGRLARARTGGERRGLRSLWIRSGRDEIIPQGAEDGVREMYAAWVRASEAGGAASGRDEEPTSRWVDVPGALHDTAYMKRRWRDEIRAFLRQVAQEK
ncbi:hypothetical protein Rhopal_000640-T1 [Rhodotorula paludigena]|uniref:Alpha/beta-hydrolase n=1 Tax=Rhodotorula paludigena TaxID=86838 RepID=A0AAV5GD63_9BASI|nr:hypothetical protein Rhopal_000640-T1 [Rhodotorula paludigena]